MSLKAGVEARTRQTVHWPSFVDLFAGRLHPDASSRRHCCLFHFHVSSLSTQFKWLMNHKRPQMMSSSQWLPLQTGPQCRRRCRRRRWLTIPQMWSGYKADTGAAVLVRSEPLGPVGGVLPPATNRPGRAEYQRTAHLVAFQTVAHSLSFQIKHTGNKLTAKLNCSPHSCQVSTSVSSKHFEHLWQRKFI